MMMMKQCTTTSSSKQSSLFLLATEDELLVSQILLDLENMFMMSESCPKFVWGCKRRRSSLDVAPSLSSAPSSKSPLVQRTEDEIEVRRPQVKAEEEGPAAAAAATSSPATPLSFSPSESDEKSKHSSKKSSKKRSREEYIDMIEGLTQRGDLLRGEIENVRKYYNKLKAHNSELKAMKQEVLNTCPRKEEPQNRFMNLGMDLTQRYRITVMPHHQPLIEDSMAQKFQNSYGPITTQVYSSNNGLESVNRVGPVGIPDLNLSAEEAPGVDAYQPLDVNNVIADKRARFAEARRLRRGIIKIKSMRSACGIKLPRTGF